ncbi:MAG: 50S ribosomal protein L5 [Candidatus Pacebacteria bacterium]|nr:50S ribosomal protein L5 [Candidatus Paceibacterota bacterium]
MLRLKEKYKKEIIPVMKEKFSYKSIMAVPKVEKVVLNIGFGKRIFGKTGSERKKIYESILNELSVVAGQKPVLTKSKKSIAGFKVRKGIAIGAKVTLRGSRMHDFLDKLIHIALPRSRDFRGIPFKSIDKNGNLTIGFKEHISFPEILPEKIKQILGFEITVVTTTNEKERGLELLKLLGFPIKV